MVAAYKEFTIQLGYMTLFEQRAQRFVYWRLIKHSEKEKGVRGTGKNMEMMYKYYEHDFVHLR